nr:ribonuclease H-like domain, reverse transcriptase, RNA-dependent DNA polymerase [Tanacetum cinerariifolium]GEY19058.1 ribonuclease H-like domain, reverse transcriptase, RNA-dependent DNA polymerase [Tanacetum cinerariifolium]
MVINSPCLTDKKELASPGQTTTSKDFSNSLMDGYGKSEKDQIQALVDKTELIITEDSIRNDLYFDDAKETACLLNEEIFEGLARMGYEKPSQKLTFYKAYSPLWKFLILTILQCLSAKTTAWNEFNSTMASAIISLANNQKFNFSKYIFDNMKKQQPRRKQRKEPEVSHDESEDEDHVPTPSSDPLRSGKDSSILNELMVFCTSLQKQRKLRSRGIKRLKKFGSVRRVKSPMEKNGLGAQEDPSKQEKMIEEIDQNAEIALDDETQRRIINDEMFGVDDLAGEEVVMQTTTGVKDSAAPTIDDKGKAKMIEPEVHIKRKEQMRIDEEYARKLEAEEQEAARLSRAQQDEEANNS